MAYINIYISRQWVRIEPSSGKEKEERKKERNTMDEILEKQERNVEQMTNLDS